MLINWLSLCKMGYEYVKVGQHAIGLKANLGNSTLYLRMAVSESFARIFKTKLNLLKLQFDKIC